ncbi:PREDICTED: kita-kyushu lung cancer antigen 1 homolog [Rhinopithecus bieti]|uniref:Cancer/testis antigen 83 n=1 Tax=Rhinopithecus bieti TaxID=61621 RepID=A0A2K6LBR8_RHIBE|nr:PREDICTED: kita-kyushu lung cancer antigen 1 homolog [Rhinopithecus bieti]
MNVYLLLASGILCALMTVFWKYRRFQRNTGEMSSISTAFALRRSSTGLINSNTDNNLSVYDLSRDILNNFPHSIAMQKRILVNLTTVENKLVELEHILVSKGFRSASAHRKST